MLLAVYAADEAVGLQHLPAVEIRRRVWVQQYYVENDEVRWRRPDNMPSTEQVIPSPYDPDARYRQKRQTAWFGYKAHVTETCDEEQPHLITHLETPPATTQDDQVTEAVHHALEQKNLLPAEHLLDRGYVNTPVLMRSAQHYGVEVIGPIQVDTTWQAQAGQGCDLSRFAIDWDPQRVTGPGGQVSQVWAASKDHAGHPRVSVRFAKASCQSCPMRSDCTRSAKGPRTLSFKPRGQYELLPWARQREHTEDFKER